jgi:hypothetical protein
MQSQCRSGQVSGRREQSDERRVSFPVMMEKPRPKPALFA